MPLDLEPVAAPFFHAVDELLVGGIQHLLPELGLLGLLRLERIEERLVLAGGIDAPLDTELLHGADETEAGRRHADGADQAGLVGVDLVGGAGDVVGAGGTQVADHRIDLDVRVLAAQATNLVIDIAGLHRTAARTVDPQDDPLGTLILERRAQGRDDIVGTGRLIVGDHALHLDQCRVATAARGRFLQAAERTEGQQHDKEIDEGQRLEEYPPAPRPPLLLDPGEDRLFQQLPALVVIRLRRFRLPLVRHAQPLLKPPHVEHRPTRRATR